MKLCKDCKHARPDRSLLWLWSHLRWEHARCAAEPRGKGRAALTSGRVTPAPLPYCDTARSLGSCGEEGKQWEPRK